MDLFYFYLFIMGLTTIYLFGIRLQLIRYIGFNYSVETYKLFMKREWFWMLVNFGFLATLWAVTMLNLWFEFLY